MEGNLGQNCFAGEQRFANRPRKVERPQMMAVAAITKGNDEAGVSNSFHRRENPLRDDRSGNPFILPACRKNAWFPISDFAASNSSRIIRPTVRRSFVPRFSRPILTHRNHLK